MIEEIKQYPMDIRELNRTELDEVGLDLES